MSLFSRIFRGTPTTDKPVPNQGRKSHVIEFILWKDDLPLEIQLEPECILFKVEPDNTLKFVALADDNDFKWSLRIDGKSGGIQLFPEGKGNSNINVYENNELLEDWFKYMR